MNSITEQGIKDAIKRLQEIRTEKRKYLQQPNMLKSQLYDIGKRLIELSEKEK